MADKPPTMASLARTAARSQSTFVEILHGLIDEDDPDRLEDFFKRFTLPQGFGEDQASDTSAEHDAPAFADIEMQVTTFDDERRVAAGLEKFVERHVRKLRWHVSHPSIDTIGNGIMIYQSIAVITEIRIRRVLALLRPKEVLTPLEWGLAREMLNRAYRDFRRATTMLTIRWVEALLESCDRDEVRHALAPLPEVVHESSERLSKLRDRVEQARALLTVQPEGYPPVCPPRYFGGDLLDATSWKHYWGDMGTLAANLRQKVEA